MREEEGCDVTRFEFLPAADELCTLHDSSATCWEPFLNVYY